jgi:hypothetical protein
MNYTILFYLLYLVVILYVILHVGAMLYKNGAPFLMNTFHGDKVIAAAVNKFLLVGYYLMNIGYSIIVLKIWSKVDSFQGMLEVLSFKTGGIILMLGVMHFINVFSLICLGKRKEVKKINHNINLKS